MIDALLLAVVDEIRDSLGYDRTTCLQAEPPGRPPPRVGDVYVAVHQGNGRNSAVNSLDTYWSFTVTVTQRVVVPVDRIGDQMLVKKVANESGFNGRCNRLGVLLGVNWDVLYRANNYLVQLAPDGSIVYGFSEPAHWADSTPPRVEGGDWFGAAPEAQDQGLVADLYFEGARRLQALEVFT